MTAGMAFEALNNAGVTSGVNVLVVLNDNDMSISPPVGALNRYLARLMSGRFYANAKNVGRVVLQHVPPVLELARRLEVHAKGMLSPATLFEELGFNYVGPIDGHDLDSLVPRLKIYALWAACSFCMWSLRKGAATNWLKRIRSCIMARASLIQASEFKSPRPPPSKRSPGCSDAGCVIWPRRIAACMGLHRRW